MRVGIAVLVLFGLWLVGQPASGDSAGGSAPTLVRADRSTAIAPDQLEGALAETSVLARLPAEASVQMFGVSVRSVGDSTVVLGASADFVHAACLRGSIQSNGVSAGPGVLILWRPDSDQPERFDFDIARFLATSSLTFSPDLQNALGQLAERQRRLIFWGALARTNKNAQSLVSPALEPTRRAYLRRPAVIRLRLEHQDTSALARATTQEFVAALAAGDAETVADLLNPALFVTEDAGMGSNEWQRLRRAFADDLVRQPWRTRLSAGEVEATDDPGLWYVRAAPSGFVITISTFDAMTFVAAVAETAVPPAGLRGEEAI